MQDLLVKVREQFVLAEKEDDFRAWVQRDGLQWSIAEIAEDLYGEEYTQSDKARQSQIHNTLSQRLRRTRRALCEWVAQAQEKGLL